MSDEQGWDQGMVNPGPATGGTALTLENGDSGRNAPDIGPVSVRLTDTGELPFLQPRPDGVRVETVPGWMDRLSSLGRRPTSVLAGAIIAGLVFAAFFTQAGQDRRSTNGAASPVPPALGDGGSAVGNDGSIGGLSDDGVAGLMSSVADPGSGETDPVARSSGDAFEAGNEGTLAVQVVEPVEALAGPTTTMAQPTTAAPTTAATTTESPTTAEPTTTAETTTTTTGATTTTAEATTTTAEATTTTTADDDAAERGDVWVEALSPGSSGSGDAPAIDPGDIILRAEGSQDIIVYRFRIYIQDDDEWERVESSGWRLRPRFDTRFRRYEDRTIRWTVEGRTVYGTRTPTSPPLHIYVD